MNNIEKEQISVLIKVLDPNIIKTKSPILLIGKAVSLFKKIYKGNIFELKNTDEVKQFVSEYTGIEVPKPVVISDIGYLQPTAAFLLLKLVEESKSTIILLSTNDNISSILLSRVKEIVKFPVDENTNNSMMSVCDAYNMVYSNNENKPMNKIKFYAENCPLLYKIENDVPYSKYRNSIIEILGGSYD